MQGLFWKLRAASRRYKQGHFLLQKKVKRAPLIWPSPMFIPSLYCFKTSHFWRKKKVIKDSVQTSESLLASNNLWYDFFYCTKFLFLLFLIEKYNKMQKSHSYKTGEIYWQILVNMCFHDLLGFSISGKISGHR